MNIEKVKHKAGETTIRYTGKVGDTVYTLESSDLPLPELNEALQALAVDVQAICELDPQTVPHITVLGVTISNGDDTDRAVISATLKLSSGATMCLNTPCIPFDSEHGPQLSGATISRIDTLCGAAADFVNGERAQGELPLDTQETMDAVFDNVAEQVNAGALDTPGVTVTIHRNDETPAPLKDNIAEFARRTGANVQRDVKISK